MPTLNLRSLNQRPGYRFEVVDDFLVRENRDMATAYVARMLAVVPLEHIAAWNAFIRENIDQQGSDWITPSLSPTGEEPATHGRCSAALLREQFVLIADHICALSGIQKPVGWNDLKDDQQIEWLKTQHDPIFAASGIYFQTDDNTGEWRSPDAVLDDMGLVVIAPADPEVKKAPSDRGPQTREGNPSKRWPKGGKGKP